MSADSNNADQIAYWNGAGGRHWAARQEDQDAVLEPVSRAALDRAAVQPGERVIDIGCGAGATTLALARLVGPSGQVLGIDVSEPMLARAAERIAPGLPIALERADATTHEFARGAFDLLFSRFGVMFFADPARTFANLRTALKPGGRLVFACWRKPDDNAWVMVPLRAAYEHVPPLPRQGPEEPGLFSFASEERVRRILGAAGFTSVAFEPHDFEFDIARGRGIDAAVTSGIEIGPASRALAGQPPEIVEKAAASIHRALAARQQGLRVPLAAAIWVVSATNP